MPDSETLSHTKWDCKYHVVFIPQYRRKALYHAWRRHLWEVFRSLAEQKECRIADGHLMADHVHMLLSIPPKYSVAQVVGFIKGKGNDSSVHPDTRGGRSPLGPNGLVVRRAACRRLTNEPL
jgi:REP element-mobilizing transposase RayT